MREGAKRFLFKVAGPKAYARLHAWRFRRALSRALASPAAAETFFGHDLLAFAALLEPGQTVLDIGAFLGGSTALFCRAVGPTGRVIAFEPVHHEALAALAADRGLPAWIESIALGDSAGPAELVIPMRRGVPLYSQAAFPSVYRVSSAPASGFSFERRPARRARLDDWLAEHGLAPGRIAAVKIDVEGSEMDVLRGGEAFFRRFPGPLLCEFWLGGTPTAWSWLRDRGYHCRYLGRDGVWRQVDTAVALAQATKGETYGNFLLQRG